METVTISKKEYTDLVEKKIRYELIRGALEDNLFAPPPTKNINEIAAQLRATHKYNARFVESVKRGLRRSSYFKP